MGVVANPMTFGLEFSFPSLKQVALLRLKSPVCSTIYPYLGTEENYAFLRASAQSKVQTAL